jgi:multidrug efflux system membrane fusion protein
MVSEGGTARFRAVEIIRDDEEGVWVSGIGDRAEVVVVGQEYISDGSRLNATPQTGTILGSPS